MITKFQLSEIVPATKNKIDEFFDELIHAMEVYSINTPLRMAAFIAQIAHESGAFRYSKEIWGPTLQQLKYEPTTNVSKQLGNTMPGDGQRFKGRGFIQVTGRSNYAQISKDLGVDFVSTPELLEHPKYVCLSAGWFWNKKNLNELADQKKFMEITKKINGGLNGIDERNAYYIKAIDVLKENLTT